MKNSLSDLAIFGGNPAFDEKLHVGTPNLGRRDRLLGRIESALDRRWLTNHGPYVVELESRLAEYLGVRHCTLVSNATTGLEIAARALDLTGEVIVPAMTFIATAHAMRWLGLQPVFCDVDPCSHNIDPLQVEALITPRTSAILGVHLWGRPCQVDALRAIAERRDLKLFFDAAHALSCSYQGRMVGNFGDLEVFSFHATKFFNTFEGGAITTNDDQLATRLRLMQNFGFETYDTVISLGINGKMSEISAAMGLTLLESLDGLVAHNLENYQLYRQGLEGLKGFRSIRYDERERNNYQYVVVEVDEQAIGINRDQLVRVLWAENVLARRYFFPGCHNMEPYRSEPSYAGLSLPVTERLTSQTLSLPTGTAVSPQQVSQVCELLHFVLCHAREVTGLLNEFT